MCHQCCHTQFFPKVVQLKARFRKKMKPPMWPPCILWISAYRYNFTFVTTKTKDYIILISWPLSDLLVELIISSITLRTLGFSEPALKAFLNGFALSHKAMSICFHIQGCHSHEKIMEFWNLEIDYWSLYCCAQTWVWSCFGTPSTVLCATPFPSSLYIVYSVGGMSVGTQQNACNDIPYYSFPPQWSRV